MGNAYLVFIRDSVDGIEFATIIEDDDDLGQFFLALDREKYEVEDVQTIPCGLTRSIDFYKKTKGLEFGN